ncbi:MAG: ATP-binding cassette domain-containing protein [Actinobacteria bacterium]|nr:ATP-binding cassette domain-containing protein [Actinomycetota bacterium]
MPHTEPALTLEGLTKCYGRRVAVDHLTAAIPPGVVAGFVGPNGAGKTTTMSMLLGLVRPTSGTATVLGEPLERPDRYLGRVGALVDGPALWPALTGVQNLKVLCRLGGHDETTIPGVLDLVGLGTRGSDRFGAYSMGMKQRLGIAAALLGDPALLVLDEPTNGLDPQGMSDMRDLIRRIATQDRTVLVSSHILTELEQVCDWLLIIDDGRLVYAGQTEGFVSPTGTEVVLGPLDPGGLPPLLEVVTARGLTVRSQGDHLVVTLDGDDPRRLAADLNRAASTAGIVLAEVHVRRPSLESTYLQLLEGASR